MNFAQLVSFLLQDDPVKVRFQQVGSNGDFAFHPVSGDLMMDLHRAQEAVNRLNTAAVAERFETAQPTHTATVTEPIEIN